MWLPGLPLLRNLVVFTGFGFLRDVTIIPLMKTWSSNHAFDIAWCTSALYQGVFCHDNSLLFARFIQVHDHILSHLLTRTGRNSSYGSHRCNGAPRQISFNQSSITRLAGESVELLPISWCKLTVRYRHLLDRRFFSHCCGGCDCLGRLNRPHSLGGLHDLELGLLRLLNHYNLRLLFKGLIQVDFLCKCAHSEGHNGHKQK